MTYTISPEMRIIAKQLKSDNEFIQHLQNDQQTLFELSAFKCWLEIKENVDKKEEIKKYLLIQACLQALAKELDIAFEAYQEKKVKASTKIKWFLLLLAGTAVVGSDAAGTVLGWVGSTSISVAILVAVAITYAVIAIAMFYAFELYVISCHLGISFRTARYIVDRYLHELQQIEGFIEGIEKKRIDKNTPVLEDEQSLVEILTLRLSALKQAKEKLDQTVDSKKVKIAKGFLTVTGVLIYAAAGFFSGNAAASSIAAIFMATAVPFVFWPTLLAGAVIALCAIVVYLYTQKPTIEEFVENALGLDGEKLQAIEHTISRCEKRIEIMNSQNPKMNRTALEINYQHLEEENRELRKKLQESEKPFNIKGDMDLCSDSFSLGKNENDSSAPTFLNATSLDDVNLSVNRYSFLNQNLHLPASHENELIIEEYLENK